MVEVHLLDPDGGSLEEGAENRREKTGTGKRFREIIGEILLRMKGSWM